MKVILWTGGYDSTALVLRAIEEDQSFRTLSFGLPQNEAQCESEKLAREAIVAALKPKRSWRHDHAMVPNYGMRQNGLIQPVIWLNLAALCGDDVELGWVKGDCVWHYIEAIRNAFKVFSAMNNMDMAEIKLLTPFEWEDKESLLRYYMRDPITMSVLGMISVSETGRDWRTSENPCEKGVIMKSLYDKAMSEFKNCHSLKSTPADARVGLVDQAVRCD